MLNRFFLSIGFLWASFNGIGLLLLSSGPSARSNILWPLLSVLLSFEYSLFWGIVWALKLAAQIAAGGLVAYGVFLFVAWTLEFIERIKAKRAPQFGLESSQDVTGSHPSVPVPAPSQADVIPKLGPMPYYSPPRPAPPKPTAQELKAKAIEQITRGFRS